MKVLKVALSVIVLSIGWISCANNADPKTLVGVWDMIGQEQTEFSSRLAVFDETSYMWMADNVYRYRYSEQGGRPMLHLDGDYQKDFHLIKVHADTLILTDGKTPYGVLVKSRGTAMKNESDIAYRDIETAKKFHASALKEKLDEARIYVTRRYK